MIADEVIEVTDKELRDYESTGRKMEAPKMSAKVKAMRVAEFKAKNSKEKVVSAPATTMPAEAPAPKPRPIMDIPPVKKLFVHIKNPDDHSSLLLLKQICGEFPGKTDIILVLGAEKKSAIKLPFKVDGSDNLLGSLVKQLGEDCVVLK
jgi:hypothetical protein